MWTVGNKFDDRHFKVRAIPEWSYFFWSRFNFYRVFFCHHYLTSTILQMLMTQLIGTVVWQFCT